MAGGVAVDQPHVLLVEGNASSRRTMARALASAGFDVAQAGDGGEALEMIAAEPFNLIVSETTLPRLSAVELIHLIRERGHTVPVILLAEVADAMGDSDQTALGVVQYIRKPVESAALVAAVERATRSRDATREERIARASAPAPASENTALNQSLTSALSGLWMAFQPIIRSTDGYVFGYEALMRSQEAALPHPGANLDAAERLNRLDEVGRRVRSIAPTSFDSAPEGSSFFINLHSADLNDPSLLDPASALVRNAKRVVLEITERATLDGVANVSARIASLREAGFRIAVDDLGAGYAGLTSFALLEPDIAKIDMSLVRAIDASLIRQKLVRSLVTACRDLGVTVVAEGIETTAERDCLSEMGCELLQGFLLGRPGKLVASVA